MRAFGLAREEAVRMNCKKIQELIITDYLDNEVSAAVREEVRAHLASCPGCREFEQAVRRSASEPFRKMKRQEPSAEIWQRIKAALEQKQEKESRGLLAGFLDSLSSVFRSRKPVFALSSAIAAAIMVIFLVQAPLYRQKMINQYLQDESQYMLSLRAPVNGGIESELEFGTGIEQYFF